MIYSMTGYGRVQNVLNGREITIEIKSVNHRYFEYSSRLPRTVAYLDDAIKKAMAETISRGKVEVNLSLQNISAKDTIISVNKDIARGYYEALSKLAEELNISNDIKISNLARFNDIFSNIKNNESEEIINGDVLSTLQETINIFLEMRNVEGEAIKKDLLNKIGELEQETEIIEKKAIDRASIYYDKLYKKMQTILSDTQIDENRILQEAAIYADKVSIDEEIVRLKSHFEQCKSMLEASSPIGKKLDFLIQEMNREINTIGSKANDLQITDTVINVKSGIEKIREQIQNIE